MKKIKLSVPLILSLFISGCSGIGGDPIPDLLVLALVPALIFYVISIPFIGIGILIKKFIAGKLEFEKNKLSISIISAILLFLILNIPLLLIGQGDLSAIFSYLITPCSFALFLGMYKDKFWRNMLFLLVLMLALIFVFAIEFHYELYGLLAL